MAVKRKPAHRSQDRQHKRKKCKDCVSEGLENRRPAPHPGPRCTTHHREFRSQRRSVSQEQRWQSVYGISGDEYWRIYDQQNGRCAICQRATGARKRLSVDHCHETGVVRGLLCLKCNRDVLGHLRDDTDALQRAIDYLDAPPAVLAIGVRITPDVQDLTMNGEG